MMAQWNEWMAKHKGVITETAGAGKTKSVSSTGVSDTRNDIMLTSIVTAESQEAAAELFVDCPHFGIPEATIEVMELRYLPEME
jgi:hypothetical protein